MKIANIFKERDPTQGRMIGSILAMSGTFWSNSVLQIIVIQVLNLLWVSKLGAEAVAAVALGGTILMFLMTPILGVEKAIYGLIGKIPQEDTHTLEQLTKQILATSFCLTLLLAFLGYFFTPWILGLFEIEPEVFSPALTYLRICVLGGIVGFLLWVINAIIRTARGMTPAMIIMISVYVLQGVFDYLLILGNFGFPRLEVAGAAISMVLAMVTGTIMGFWVLMKGKCSIKISFSKNLKDYLIKPEILKKIIRVAGFDFIEEISRMSFFLFILWIVAPFGSLALAAYGIGQRLFRAVVIVGLDLGRVTSIGVAQNLGVKKINRAKKWAWSACYLYVLFMGIVGATFFIFANQIIGIFSQDPEVLAIGTSYLKITSLGYIFFGMGLILKMALVGAGDTRTPMIIYLLTAAIQIGLVLLLSELFGVIGIWVTLLFGMLFHGTILAILFKFGYFEKQAISKIK